MKKGLIHTDWGSLLVELENDVLVGIKFPAANEQEEVLDPDETVLEVIRQLNEFFKGKTTGFSLSFKMKGTSFQQEVWRELLELPYGKTSTYSALAEKLGGASHARAVARAIALNPLLVIVPCHRVIGTDGNLTGYAGGLERKRKLLELEKAIPTQTDLYNEI